MPLHWGHQFTERPIIKGLNNIMAANNHWLPDENPLTQRIKKRTIYFLTLQSLFKKSPLTAQKPTHGAEGPYGKNTKYLSAITTLNV